MNQKIRKNNNQQSNLAVAQHIATKLSKLEGIKAILLYGSIGKGYSDEYSDIDLIAICDGSHSKTYSKTKEVARLFSGYNLIFKEQELSVSQFDQYPLQNRKDIKDCLSYRSQCVIDYDDRKIDTTIRLISSSVIKRFESKATKDISKYQSLVAYIINTKTLYSKDESFEKWKRETGSFKTFAPKLQKKFINHCLDKLNHYLKAEIADSMTRDDFVLHHYEFDKCIVLFLYILYALNDHCLPYPKWVHRDIEKFSIKPRNLKTKLRNMVKKQDPELLRKLLQDVSNRTKKFH